MINTNILKILESNFQDPSYSIIISKFEQPEHCNKDKLKIYVQQFNPNLEKIIENKETIIEELKSLLESNNIEIPDTYELKINSCIQKTLNIESMLDYNKSDGLYISKLTGTLDNDIDLNLLNRYVEANIENKRVTIVNNDVPNYFNRSKFKIKNNKLVVSIPKKVDTLTLKITDRSTNNTTTYNENNIVNNVISANINLNKQYDFTIRYTLKETPVLQSIESVVTQLSSTIEIEFENKYSEIPAIIPTIDEDHKVYSSYSTEFETDGEGYTGVTINFRGLKRQKQYGDINITIVGKVIKEE